jgi:hypothetical protein
MENFITGLVLAVAVAPFIWPPFVMIYRYFRDLEDQRYARKHSPAA